MLTALVLIVSSTAVWTVSLPFKKPRRMPPVRLGKSHAA